MAVITDRHDVNSENEKSSDYWKQFIDDGYKDAKDQRVHKVERQWFLNYVWYRGMHVKYNKLTKQLVSTEDPEQRFYVNKINPIVRAVRAYITQYEPIWDVDARPYGTLNRDTQAALADFLDYQHDRLDMNDKDNEAVLYGLLYSVGIYMYGWDQSAYEGLGDVWVDVLDPFDVYIDPLSTDIDDARWVMRVIKKPLELIEKNSAYSNTEKLSEDNKHSASDYKNQLASVTYGATQQSSKNTDKTILLYETWVRDRVTEEVPQKDEAGQDMFDEQGQPVMESQEKSVIRVVVKAGNEIIRNEVTPYEDLPFVLYKADTLPGELYGEGWVKHLIPLNKQLNALERSMAEYHQVMAKGRYIMDKNSGVKTITNENGSIIKKNPGTSVQELPMGNYSSSAVTQIQNMNRYMEEVGGISDTFKGQVPTQLSGVAIEQLIAASGNNLKEPTNNLVKAKSKLGECILKLASKYYDEARAIKKVKRGEEGTTFQVIGQRSLKDDGKPAPENVVIIPYNSEVTVKISSGLGYTKEAKQERANFLFDKGALSKSTLLETMGIDPNEEIQKVQEERLEDADLELSIQQKASEAAMQQQMMMQPPADPMMDPAMMPI